MKIFFLVLLFSSLSLAQDMCAPKTTTKTVDDCVDNVSKILSHGVSDDTPESAIKAAELFLVQYGEERVDFDSASAENLVQRLENFAAMESLPAPLRSRLYLKSAGVHAKLAQKLRSLQHGQSAFFETKKSISLDKNNKDAISSYAKGVAGMAQQSSFKKTIIEMTLNVKLVNERDEALKLLEQSGQTKLPVYQTLKQLK